MMDYRHQYFYQKNRRKIQPQIKLNSYAPNAIARLMIRTQFLLIPLHPVIGYTTLKVQMKHTKTKNNVDIQDYGMQQFRKKVPGPSY